MKYVYSLYKCSYHLSSLYTGKKEVLMDWRLAYKASEGPGFVSPRDPQQVDRDTGQDHDNAPQHLVSINRQRHQQQEYTDEDEENGQQYRHLLKQKHM